MPLSHEIKGRGDKGHSHPEVIGDLMSNFFEVTDLGQHGQNSLYEHAGVPSATRADLHVAGIACFAMPRTIHQNHGLFLKCGDHGSKASVGDTGEVAIQRHEQPQVIEHKAQFCPNDPAQVRQAFVAQLLITPTFSDRKSVV